MKDETIDSIFELIDSFRIKSIKLAKAYNELEEEHNLLKTQLENCSGFKEDVSLSNDEIFLVNLFRLGQIDKYGNRCIPTLDNEEVLSEE